MGMSAYIMAMGPYSDSENVSPYLEYPPSHYVGTPAGTIVFSNLFNCETRSRSYELAELLGCEVQDFATHVIDPSKVNTDLLLDAHFSVVDVEHFLNLKQAGFKFYFRVEY